MKVWRILVTLLLLCAWIVPTAWSQQVTITVMCVLPAQPADMMPELVARFEASHPNIKVELVNGDDAKVLTSIASGLIPDAATINQNTSVNFYKSGGAYDLTDFIIADNFDLSVIPPNYESLMYNGRWYGMPNGGGAFADLAIFYNRDMFSAAGLANPTYRWTWAEFSNAVQRLSVDKQNDGVFEVLGFTFASDVTWPVFVWSGGGEIFSADRSTFLMTDPKTVNALEFWADLARRGFIKYPVSGFTNGTAAMRQAAYLDSRTMISQNLIFDWSIVEFPQGSAGAINRRATHPWIIPASAKNPREGWEWIKFWLSEEVQTDLVMRWNFRAPQTTVVAQKLARQKLDTPPYSYAPFTGVNGKANSLPIDVPNWPEIDSLIGATVKTVWNGTQSVAAAMAGIAAQVMTLAHP
jgi:multiple sugar transport system substrate-binding protein